MSDEIEIKEGELEVVMGMAADGKEFTAESPEVVAYQVQFPDVNLDAAIGSVVMEYNKTLATEVPVEEVPETPSEQA